MKFCLLWGQKNNLFKQMRKNLVLGLDIGGSGVKGAVVDVVKGEFVGDRIRIPTPSPHTPSNIISAICEIVDGFKWKGPIGCGFPGVAKWMQIQAREEIGHAEKIYEYLIERRVQFKTSSVQKPETDVFASPLDGFKAAYEHEQKVTAQIEKICDAAEEDKDRVTVDFLSEFLKEQVEEENNTFKFVRALEYAGDDKNLIIGVDKWADSRAE